MRNKKVAITVVICFIAVFATYLIWFFASCPKRINYRNFSDIQDFTVLNTDVKTGVLTDRKLKDLTPASSFVHYVVYNGKVFELYAYVFSSQEDAICYFDNCTGKAQLVDSNFTFSSNGFHSDFITFQNCCLYRVEGGNPKSVAEFVEYVSSLFALPQETQSEE